MEAVGQRPHSSFLGPLHGITQHGSLYHQNKQEKKKKAKRRVSAKWKSVFYNLISEVTSHDFECIVLVRSKSLGPTPRVGDHIGYKYQEGDN